MPEISKAKGEGEVYIVDHGKKFFTYLRPGNIVFDSRTTLEKTAKQNSITVQELKKRLDSGESFHYN